MSYKDRLSSFLDRVIPEAIKKRLLLIFFITIIVLAGYIAYSFTVYSLKSNELCSTCHNMEPYVQSIQQSDHSQLNCHRCHELTPAVVKELWIQLTEAPTAQEIKERTELNLIEPCIKCHQPEQLAESQIHQAHLGISFKSNSCNICHNPHFSEELDVSCSDCHDNVETIQEHADFHDQALLQLERGDALACANCHSGEAKTEIALSPDCIAGLVTGQTCFQCHEAPLDPPNIQGRSCTSCHN